MRVESCLDTATQHPKWSWSIPHTLPAKPDALELEQLIKAAVVKLAEQARRDGVGEWSNTSHAQVMVEHREGNHWSAGHYMFVKAKVLKLTVDQQPFTTWDRLFAQLVWPTQ